MKLFNKISLFLLLFIFQLGLISIRVLAGFSGGGTIPPKNDVVNNRPNVPSTGNSTATGGMTWSEDGYTLNIDITSTTTGKDYFGEGNYGHFNNPTNTSGKTTNEKLIEAGCDLDQINDYYIYSNYNAINLI